VVAFDGGGSKTDAVAVTLDGDVLGTVRGPTSSPHLVGLGASVAVVSDLLAELVGDAVPAQLNVYLSGLDLPVEVTDYRAALAAMPWATSSTVVENDLFALLRAGTEERNAAAVVCGTGINAIGIRDDGATSRFVALGQISGDWGGGGGLGEQALWHAARAEDGRAGPTSLVAAVAEHFGRASIVDVSIGLHLGQIVSTQLGELGPVVLAHAEQGDAIAGYLIERQAEEIALMAVSALSRLGLADADVPVVLGGGVVRAAHDRLLPVIHDVLADRAPRARTVLVTDRPIVGAALLALETAGASAPAVERARTLLTAS
jgi:N-acetylglucosamine kinase-like BadF-type ATPase